MRREGLSNRFCLSVSRQKNIEIRPLRVFTSLPGRRFCPHGSFSGALAVPKISEVRPAYRNCKLRANTDGMHG